MGVRGRPTKLTPALADRLVDLLADGASVTDAARAVGVTPSTIRNWRTRAWSRAPRDLPFVELERRLIVALATPPAADVPDETDWQVAAARLEADAPERWWLHEPLDDIDGV